MQRWMGGSGRPVIGGVLLLMSLAACTQPPQRGGSLQSGSNADWMTESDEPDVRKRARLRTELATGYFEQGKTTVALDEIKQALAIDPTYSPAYNLRGMVYMQLGEWSLAKESLVRATSVNPRDADAAHNLGWLQCQLKDYADAVRWFQRALAVPGYPSAVKTHLASGVCSARANDWPTAEASLTRAFELDPANPMVGYNLGQVLFRRGEHARAQFHLHRLNGSTQANAESLWLGIKIERQLGNALGVRNLSEQLRLKFPQSSERQKLDRGAFDE